MEKIVESLKNGLIVSCQPHGDTPVCGPRIMAAFARAAAMGGCVGIRANGAPDIRAIRKAVDLPIIGIKKWYQEKYPVYITPTLQAARQVRNAGADIIAVDATHRSRRGGLSPEALISAIHHELGCPVMADIDNLEEGIAAACAGADLVATTLAGNTSRHPQTSGPDLDLLKVLAAEVNVPVICEGRIWTPGDVAAAFAAGAFAVVCGTAITDPLEITHRMVARLPIRTPPA